MQMYHLKKAKFIRSFNLNVKSFWIILERILAFQEPI